MKVRETTASQPAMYAAPHDAWYDGLNMLYPVKVTDVIYKGRTVFFIWGTPAPYGRKDGEVGWSGPEWVYPLEAVQVEGRQTAQLPFGQGTTILPYSWVQLRTLPDAAPVDDPIGQLADDGGPHVD